MITNEMPMIKEPGKSLGFCITIFNGSSFTFITACYDIRLVVNRVDYQLTTQVLELAKQNLVDDT